MKFHPRMAYVMEMTDMEVIVSVNRMSIEFSLWEKPKHPFTDAHQESFEDWRRRSNYSKPTRVMLGGSSHSIGSFPQKLKKWEFMLEVLSSSCTQANAEIVQRIFYDEIEVDTWTPGKPSWLNAARPTLFKFMLEGSIAKRVRIDWVEKRDRWMGEWFPESYERATRDIMKERQKTVESIMER